MKVMDSKQLGKELVSPELGYCWDDCYDDPHYHLNGGLTKRELFAAMVMQGYCSGVIGMQDTHVVAKLAVEQADALLKELSK